MKIHILHLEGHDDLAAARDKLSFSHAPVTLVVWPRRGRVLTTRLELLRFARSAGEAGTRLIFVTHDEEVRELAADLGIPAFSDLESARRVLPASRRILPRRFRAALLGYQGLIEQRRQIPARDIFVVKSPWLRALIFAAAVFAILVIAALFIPSARVVLPMRTSYQNLTIELQASPEFSTPQLSGAIPAHPVVVVVEGQDEIKSRGEIFVAETYASAEIEFTNLTTGALELPAGTVVRTLDDPPVRFSTLYPAKLEAPLNSKVRVPARALEPGSSGNVPAGSLVAVEGAQGARVRATNLSAASGGGDRAYPAPGKEDYAILKARLQAVLDKSALKNLRETLKPGEILLETTLQKSRLIKEDFFPAEGEPADVLRLILQTEYTAWAVWQQDIEAVGRMALDAVLPAGSAALADTFGVIPLETARWTDDGQPARWKVFVSRTIRTDVSEDRINQALLGKTVPQAQAYLSGLPVAGAPKIVMQPSWWFWLPVLPFRVAVEEQP